MNKNYINSWIDIALKDLEISKLLYKNKMYSNSYYHFQQASEKGLKAYAFMTNTFKCEKDAKNTNHYALKIFANSLNQRQREIDFLKEYDFDKIIGAENLDNYSNNLNDGLDFLPKKDEIFEFSNKILDDILKILKELSEYKYKFQIDIKNHFIDKMDLIFDLVYKINPRKADEMKIDFNELIEDKNQFNELLENTKTQINIQLLENYNVLILFYTNLISHNHNNLTRYPDFQHNPLKYYNLRRPIIKKLPEFIMYLESTLKQLKK